MSAFYMDQLYMDHRVKLFDCGPGGMFGVRNRSND